MGEKITTDQQVRMEASEWAVEMTDGAPTLEVREQFAVWLNSDPRNEAAYIRSREVMSLMSDAAVEVRSTETEPRLPRYWKPLAGIAAIAACATFAFVLLKPLNKLTSPPEQQVYATQIAEVRDVELSDGSRITLGAKSRITVAMLEKERRVTLDSGEAYFAVSKDADRPFYVTAGETSIKVVGTQFDVSYAPQQVTVSVVEGVVEVLRKAQKFDNTVIAPVRLTAGQAVAAVVERKALETRVVAPEHTASWRNGRLSYEDATLQEVIYDANRYYEPGITFASPEVAELRVTAAFKVSQVEQMIQQLALALPITIERDVDGQILVAAQSEE